MNWTLASAAMEQRVIKTDVIASEDAYFMATHVPFTNLEIQRGGNQVADGGSMRWSEEEVYQQLIYNPENIHRLIIIRGSNGTGKSHLIRWLCARYENDKEHYDPNSEKIIFLRRLSNTIRGAIKQILDENIVLDEQMKAKLEKFVSSTQSMDPEAFKLNIYHQFIIAISSDTNDRTYSKGVRRELVAFLSDERVKQQMFRRGGPIDRCYTAITAPSSEVFHGESTFSEDDFKLSRAVKREIKNSGSMEAETFLEELSDEDAVEKLVRYLNKFTPNIIQGCADISSEGTKEVFLQLRRELKKQGKNLTIFIEDFTAFTGLDSELITVLASEHGGVNSDLCRVTSVIGITDQYYKQFRGNFTDRVQWQVFVNAGCYGSSEFLVEMTARYLNAIYCEPKRIEEWFSNGALTQELPASGFTPEYPWETTTVAGQELTLYPFNKKSINELYERLRDDHNASKGYERTPRMFLLHVLQEQLSHFFDGMSYNHWNFPTENCICGTILLKDPGQDSAIDGLTYLTEKERRRLKLLLQFWGDGTANADDTTIGGIHKKFLADIALSKFTGFGGRKDAPPVLPKGQPSTQDARGDEQEVIPPVETKQQRDLSNRISDINQWFATGSTLNYSADYRKWIREYLQESINWTSEGIPAFIAHQRITDNSSSIYIEGQKETTTKEKAIIALERTNETRDLITAIVYHNYAKSWDFKSGPYFQLKAVSWLEKHKKQIMAAVTQRDSRQQYPVLEWCAGVEYLQAAFLGIAIPHGDSLAIARKLLEAKNYNRNKPQHASGNQYWNDAIRYLGTQDATYSACHELFKESLRTFMGSDISEKQSSVGFFRGQELIRVIEEMEHCDWRLTPVDVQKRDTGIFKAADYRNNLLGKIQAATEEEDRLAEAVISKLEKHLGTITEENVTKLIASIQQMFEVFRANNKPILDNLRPIIHLDAQEKAKAIMAEWNTIQQANSSTDPVSKLALYAGDPVAALQAFVKDLDNLEQLILATNRSVAKERSTLSGGKDITQIKQQAIGALKRSKEAIDRLEVLTC